MARQLVRALELAGHEVRIISEFRSFAASPDLAPEVERMAEQERRRLAQAMRENCWPDVWFCYHPYYKAPDLLGPALCQEFDIPYVTAESSYSFRRNVGHWAQSQQYVLEGIRQARVNLCLTERDRQGLLQAEPAARCARLLPFIDPSPFLANVPAPEAGRLVTVAMMRDGDKLSSYRALAAALRKLGDQAWRLSVIGDGPQRQQVEALFEELGPERVEFLGQCDQPEIARQLSRSSIYLWPGHGEAYGLAYLEAQAAGLPVIAERIAGVPEVVHDQLTGLLVAPDDAVAYADAIRCLLSDIPLRDRLARQARETVRQNHSIAAAAENLKILLPHPLEDHHE